MYLCILLLYRQSAEDCLLVIMIFSVIQLAAAGDCSCIIAFAVTAGIGSNHISKSGNTFF